MGGPSLKLNRRHACDADPHRSNPVATPHHIGAPRDAHRSAVGNLGDGGHPGSDGHLWEHSYNRVSGRWEWANHGAPAAGVAAVGTPGALIVDPSNTQPVKMYVPGSDGHLWEHSYNRVSGRWEWANHGAPA